MSPTWRQKLQELATGNSQFAQFSKPIINSQKTILGVRTPDLRKLAKDLARPLDFAGVQSFAESIQPEIFEEVLLLGFIINYAKLSDLERIQLTKQYLKLVDSWAQIDLVVATRPKINSPLWWDFALKCLNSKAEFTVRFGVIFLMTHFLTDQSIDQTFAALRQVRHDGYYVKMALAWLYATAAVKYFGPTLQEIARPTLPNWTRQKSLQKMLESRRFSEAQKQQIRALKTTK
ncbi:MAG: DNA alkylation repair protein [Candidatus Nomurabacteria bacterium]|jgi:3-methyladenine DNA glycosylase AlkD|nr:DNA alkylation repair protein [Candidatus Nomurabacteria bacterium]